MKIQAIEIFIEPQSDFRKVVPKEQKQITEVTAQNASINGLIKNHWKITGYNVAYKISITSKYYSKVYSSSCYEWSF